MLKKLHAMAEASLQSYIDGSRELREMAASMSAADLKENSKFVVESAQVNQISEDGSIKLNIDNEGVAHIPITGMLTNNVTPSAAFEGKSITTYNFITQSTISADENPKVKSITYEINTGGGEVNGIEPASNAIFNAKKPTLARVHFAAESGGLWLASQADHIASVGKTPSFGSLGVAAEFVDRTEEDKKAGRKTIILTSTDAPDKRFDIKTAKGQKIVIDRMDEVHQVFVEHVVRGRKKSMTSITEDFVNKNFARGGSLGAEKALEIGMIDEIEGITTQNTNAGGAMVASTDLKPGAAPAQTAQNEENMTLAEFLASNAEAKAEYEKALVKAGTDATLKAETDSKELFAKVSPIISSDAYPETIKNIGLKVLSGDRPLWALTDRVEEIDAETEAEKTADVVDNQPEPTPADQHDLEDESSIKSPKIQGKITDLKKQLNV